MRKLFLVVLGVTSLLLVSLHPWPAFAADVRQRAKNAVDYSVDSALTAEIKAKLLVVEGLDSFDIKVKTTRAVVTLRGQVETVDQSVQAEKIARETKGVSDVVNKISVVP